MRKIAFLGAGRFAEQIASFVEESIKGEYKVIFFGQATEARVGVNVVPFETYSDSEFSDFEFYLALGYHQLLLKHQLQDRLEKLGRQLPPLVHHSAYVHPSSQVGAGCIIYPGVVVGPRCDLGRGVLLNTSVTLAHDVKIGAASYLAPSVTSSGCVTVGEDCFLGTGTLISNDVGIGKGSRIGIGSVVTRSLPNGTEGLGNPFKVKAFKLI